ncbi:MAG: HD domain-containing protein [Phycisphaerae bacterium]|nr:HD domain-containing protein [Phycisphaerae bacterium]
MAGMENQRLFVTDLASGMAIDQVFLVRAKDLRTTKGGDLYISATLGDSSGSIPARMWQASEAIFNSIATEGFLHVKGRVEDYRGSLQMVIDACRPWSAEKVDMADFLSVSPHDIEKMWSELLEIMREIKNPHLRRLIKKFVEDKQLVAAFKHSPAAVQMHHAYIGGLCEHTLGVARAAKALLPLYPQLNSDLVYASVFLHDIAKSAELGGGLNFHYTDRGQLVGHIVIAANWVQEKARLVSEEMGEPFPQRIIDLLQHIILAHHGEHEYGSPKLPAVPEAFFLHYLDNLDAKMWMTANAIASDPDHDSNFTGYIRPLETRLYKHSGDLDALATDDGSHTGSLFE